MTLHVSFVMPASILAASHQNGHPNCVPYSSMTRTTVTSSLIPIPQIKLLSPPRVAQIARVTMAAIQLSTVLTPSLVNPLYTPEILAILPANFPIIRALGLANLSTTITLHAHRSLARPCRLANTIAFATAAALYLATSLKPPHVNIPFTFTLALIASSNVLSFSDIPKSHTYTEWRSTSITKFAAAVVALVTAFSSTGVLLRVYLLQIAVNLAVSAGVALHDKCVSRFLNIADALTLLGMASCLLGGGSLPAAIAAVFASLSAGWDTMQSADT